MENESWLQALGEPTTTFVVIVGYIFPSLLFPQGLVLGLRGASFLEKCVLGFVVWRKAPGEP